MKIKIIIGLFVMFMLCVSPAYAQTTFVLKTNSTNISGMFAAIDHPQLNGNSEAIIIVTPLTDNFGNQYPYPVAVWFRPADKKWHVFNTNQNTMESDKLFEIKFWTGPDAKHFVHTVTQTNLTRNGKTKIDSPALDNHPRACSL